ncbi:MAG TPA: NAD(P)-dependent oxidoreductase [Polyangiaceae bacterium]
MAVSYPIALKLDSRRSVVVGGGPEALERARALLRSGARVTVVTGPAPAALAELEALAGVELVTRDFASSDLDGVWLVVLADRDEAVAERIRVEAEARRIFFCAVDMPLFSSFSYLAIARAGLAFAAIGTEGEAPALARRLREILEALFARAGLEGFTQKLAELRQRTPSERRREVLGSAVAGVRIEGELVLPPPTDER